MSRPTSSVVAKRAFFTKNLSAPDPIPEEGIEAALRLLRDGRLFRYGEDRSSLPAAALLEEEFAAALGLPLNSGDGGRFVTPNSSMRMSSLVAAVLREAMADAVRDE